MNVIKGNREKDKNDKDIIDKDKKLLKSLMQH